MPSGQAPAHEQHRLARGHQQHRLSGVRASALHLLTRGAQSACEVILRCVHKLHHWHILLAARLAQLRYLAGAVIQ